uniref:Uncharacterized protein n=1 Tax=Oryza punctata TaxID=4537 RepID=A0A0E0M508_ORYPU
MERKRRMVVRRPK